MTTTGTTLALVTAAASGVVGGVFFGFSTLVMPALRARPPAEAMAAMQAINVVAPRSLLMLPLLLSAAGCVVVVVYAVTAHPSSRGLLLAGAVAGLASMALTAGYHVPRNDALAVLDPQAPGSAAAWARYTVGWTRLNTVRAALALGSAVALVAAVVRAS
jgi:uncharacterized membrane protein